MPFAAIAFAFIAYLPVRLINAQPTLHRGQLGLADRAHFICSAPSDRSPLGPITSTAMTTIS